MFNGPFPFYKTLFDSDSFFTSSGLDYNYNKESKTLELEVDLPGVTKESLEVYVDGMYMVITGKRGESSVQKKIYLGMNLDSENISGELELGVLKLSIKIGNETKLIDIK